MLPPAPSAFPSPADTESAERLDAELTAAIETTRATLRLLPSGRPRDQLVVEAAEHAVALGTPRERFGAVDRSELHVRALELEMRAREAFAELVLAPCATILEHRYGARAIYVRSDRVTEPLPPSWRLWAGAVHTFTLEGHATAPLAYAWIRGRDGVAVCTALHDGPVRTPRLAVLADALFRSR